LLSELRLPGSPDLQTHEMVKNGNIFAFLARGLLNQVHRQQHENKKKKKALMLLLFFYRNVW
jgi:hypothetical protein